MSKKYPWSPEPDRVGQGIVVLTIFFVLAIIGLYIHREAECEQRRCTPPNQPRFTRDGCFCVEVPRE